MHDQGPPPWEMKYTGSRCCFIVACSVRSPRGMHRGLDVDVSKSRCWQPCVIIGALALVAHRGRRDNRPRRSVRSADLRRAMTSRRRCGPQDHGAAEDTAPGRFVHTRTRPGPIARADRWGGAKLPDMPPKDSRSPRQVRRTRRPGASSRDDAGGAMYGGLELAEQIRCAASRA